MRMDEDWDRDEDEDEEEEEEATAVIGKRRSESATSSIEHFEGQGSKMRFAIDGGAAVLAAPVMAGSCMSKE